MGRQRRAAQTGTLRIVIADEHRLVLTALLGLFEAVADIEVVAVTHEAERIAALIGELAPDLLLLDFQLAGADGRPLLERLHAAHPKVDIVLLTDSLAPELANVALLSRGAKGIIDKGADPDAFAPAVRAARRGEMPNIGLVAPRRAQGLGLTGREETVLLALARGHSNAQISQELAIATATVKYHLHNAYAKLGVETRVDALRVMIERSIFPYNWL